MQSTKRHRSLVRAAAHSGPATRPLRRAREVALDRPTFDTDGQALVTLAVATADEFESAVNALQAELDAMRVQGRRLLGNRD